ncbi:hypothetical protein JCM8097_007382 [Rhodosporidiobolus ruineniae]
MSSSPTASAPGSPPLRPPKAGSRIAAAAERFRGGGGSETTSPASSPQAADLSRLRESKRVDRMRENYSKQLGTPFPSKRDYLSVSPSTSTSSRLSTPSTPPPRAPAPLHSPAASPGTELASFLANLSITDPNSSPVLLLKQDSLSPAGLVRAASPSRARQEEEPGSPTAATGTQRAMETANGTGPVQRVEEEAVAVPPQVPPKETAGTDELALLVLSSSITELDMLVQEVNTLIFEIQELRHTTSQDPGKIPKPSSNGFSAPPLSSSLSSASESSSQSAAVDGPSPVSEVDAALIKLDGKLEVVRAEFAKVEEQVKPLLSAEGTGELVFVQQKWAETTKDWETAQQDAEQLGDELKEDKWLVVFRTVSQQAEDMLRSLEKVLTQAEQFILDATTRSPKSTASSLPRSPSAPISSLSASTSRSSYFPDIAAAQAQLSSFAALQKSLSAKTRYYSPACDRVLKILGKGITDRSTKNGEVLRRYGEMKARWRNLRERIGRVEAEMRVVEETLRERAGQGDPATGSPVRQPQFGNTLTPPRADAGSPGAGRVSPLRRLADKFSPRNGASSSSTPPPSNSALSRSTRLTPSASSPSISTLRSSTSTSNLRSSPSTSNFRSSPSSNNLASLAASTSSPSGHPTPPRPPKSLKRLVSDSRPPPSPSATPPQTPRALGHRRSASALVSSTPSSATSSVFGTRSVRPSSRRPPSPTPTEERERPRWNVSTRRTSEERETLSSAAMSGRPSLGMSRSGRHSSLGLRPSSRMSLSSSMARSYGPGAGMRPVSPAFSDASSVVSVARERPSTPGSRIPMPSPAVRRSHTPFSSLDDPEPTSLLQRAMSPTPGLGPPNSNRTSLSRSTSGLPSSSSRSRLPTPGALSPPRAVSPAFSASSSVYGIRNGRQTPEPNLIAQAQRLAHVRAPPTPASRPPPVPRVPSAYRSSVDPQATPRASSSGTFGGPRPSFSRPPSALSTSRYGAETPLPSSSGPSSAGVYTPNPHDPLDQSIASIVSALPLLLHVSRVDPPLSRVQAAQVELFSARYHFSLHPLFEEQRKAGAVMCKLVDKVGPRAKKGEKKVLARVGGGWQDLETYLLGMLVEEV